MTRQYLHGNRNVQIQHVAGSHITITYDGASRGVPLEPALVPLPPEAASPARMVRARSGIVPFSARQGLLDQLIDWIHDAEEPFKGCLIGGRGGSGKTRLGVELCERTTEVRWIAGLLSQSADQGGLDALVQAPTARLVIVDYAESRVEQLKILIPELASSATAENPVRLVLLVRDAPRRTNDWAEPLRNYSDALDAALDRFELHVLPDTPLDRSERDSLYEAAAEAFASRASVAAPSAPEILSDALYDGPLAIVIAAYLGVHDHVDLPTSRTALIDELLQHEQRYWIATADARQLPGDPVVLRRVVALATLTRAESEEEARELLRLLPDLGDASAERRGDLARWAHDLYPGLGWWNALEPDLVGEHLVASTFASSPAVLRGVLEHQRPATVAHSLDTYARAATNSPALAETVSPLVTEALVDLCDTAIRQVEQAARLDILGEPTVAAALNRLLGVIEIGPDTIDDAVAVTPNRADLVLSPLALTLSELQVQHRRALSEEDPATYKPDLAGALSDLAVRLAAKGQRREALAAVDEAVTIYRVLADANPTRYMPALALVLTNFASRLADIGRHDQALATSKEAVATYRAVADTNPVYRRDLARSLNNLSCDLADAGHADEALARVQEALDVYRSLPFVERADLAMSFGNLANRLAGVNRREEALDATKKATESYRALASENPTAYQASLALALNNLASRHLAAGDWKQGTNAIDEAVKLYRPLAEADPTVHEPGLARALDTFSVSLRHDGRHKEALDASREAVVIRRKLAAKHPAAQEPALAGSLHNLAVHLSACGQLDEAIGVSREAVTIRWPLARANPAAHARDLASTLDNRAAHLANARRHAEALGPKQEAVRIYRALARSRPEFWEERLATALSELSKHFEDAGYNEDAGRAREEAEQIRRRLNE
ncbi:MAG: tetratricopeptide repeat protein [Thermoleophilaceae bacterium]